MPLAVVTASSEDVDVSMAEDATEDVGEEVDEENTAKEAVKEAEAHMKMGLTSHMSLVTLRMQSGPHYKKRQEKGQHRTR